LDKTSLPTVIQDFQNFHPVCEIEQSSDIANKPENDTMVAVVHN
jgi:hypothetical protein